MTYYILEIKCKCKNCGEITYSPNASHLYTHDKQTAEAEFDCLRGFFSAEAQGNHRCNSFESGKQEILGIRLSQKN